MALQQIELEVPTTLSDIKLWQYQKYMKIIEQNKTEDAEDEEKVNDFLNMKLVEIFCNVSLVDVSRIPLKEYEKVLTILNKAFEEKPKLIQRFRLLDAEMGFIPKLDDITLGEYVDIETNITDWQKMHKAMAVLYRPINFRAKDKYDVAPYKVNEEIQEAMKDMPLDVVISSMVFFLRFREGVTGSYTEIFAATTEERGYADARAAFAKKWGWYQSIYALAKGDVRNFNAVTELPLYQCLNYLAFEKEKVDIEQQEIKKAYKR